MTWMMVCLAAAAIVLFMVLPLLVVLADRDKR
jgi:hypothetical protein